MMDERTKIAKKLLKLELRITALMEVAESRHLYIEQRLKYIDDRFSDIVGYLRNLQNALFQKHAGDTHTFE